MKKVTLSDIAARTGFSVNTVSHALRGMEDISKKTREYIEKTADEMGYIFNSAAGALRMGKSKSAAIIVGDISNPHFSILVREMEARLREYGYSAFILNTNEEEEQEKAAIVSAISKNVDGILLCPVQKTEENLCFLKQKEVPYVLFGRRTKTPASDYVVCDDRNGGFLAAEHLLQNGHGKLLFIHAPLYISSARERLMGIRDALLKRGLSAERLESAEAPAKTDIEQIRRILLEHKTCSGVICFSDLLAMTVCYCLKQEGRNVPQDVSVVGFDNISSQFFMPLMITSVTSSKTKMSVQAVDMLMHASETADAGPRQIVLPTKLIVRESSAITGTTCESCLHE